MIVVEAAYGYTLDNCDNAENSFGAKKKRRRLSRIVQASTIIFTI